MTDTDTDDGILMVANYDADVGYAWWLMESYWIVLADLYKDKMKAHLAYPSITRIPEGIAKSSIQVHKKDFTECSLKKIIKQLLFLKAYRIRTIYFSDQPLKHWRYLLFRIFGVKTIIVHDHTPGLRTSPRKTKGFLKKIAMRLPFVCVNAAIGATEFVRNRIIEVSKFPAQKTYCVQNGITKHVDFENIDIKEQFEIPDNRLIMVSASRANHYKGIDFALHCIKELINNESNKNIHFIFCGDGPDLEDFKESSKSLGIENHVTFTGRVNDINPILNKSDFAIQPSKGEVGYSLSILEYMRAELPTIVSDNISVCGATIHNQTGLIYKENDLKSACQSISKLLIDNDYRRTLGLNAKKTFLEEYDLEKAHDSLRENMLEIDKSSFHSNKSSL